MKRIFCFLLVLGLGLTSFAAEGLGTQAEKLYGEGKYADAAGLYEKILEGGQESAALYYNLGNCYFKMGENTRAILNYERSLLLDPGDRMCRYNLDMAGQAIVDKIEVLPEFFLVRWYKGMVAGLSADQWAYVAVALFVFLLVMAVLFFYSSSMPVKKTGFYAGILAFLFLVMAFVSASQQHSRMTRREYAIITAPSVTVKGSPDESGTGLFLIHEGLKVKVVEELGGWYNIRLADGNEGWIAKTDLEKI